MLQTDIGPDGEFGLLHTHLHRVPLFSTALVLLLFARVCTVQELQELRELQKLQELAKCSRKCTVRRVEDKRNSSE